MTIREKRSNCSVFVPSLETKCLLYLTQSLCNPGGKIGLFNVFANHRSMARSNSLFGKVRWRNG
ncbi:hypothetical protein Cantr_04636 [Candida viswanathii]|uniref:Uncharacterized protein n=1 Tax=Candida viswanathii TaxID=5486 RepID=A0A367XLH4_9ASCO|nr:hypothetical protein Cantr_04636 [Candida viswanathii]